MNISDYPATKKKIFLTACKLFSQKCYADVGIREIAAEAGVKVPTVYNHYPSKEAILEDLFELYTDRISRFFNRMGNMDYDQNPVDCFKKMLVLDIQDDETELMRQLMRIVLTEQHRSPAAAKVIYDISLRTAKKNYYNYLTYLKNKGVIRCEEIDSFAEIFARLGITFAMQFSRDDEYYRTPDYDTILLDMFKLILSFPIGENQSRKNQDWQEEQSPYAGYTNAYHTMDNRVEEIQQPGLQFNPTYM
jgi:AcrR family transcriptional regulator